MAFVVLRLEVHPTLIPLSFLLDQGPFSHSTFALHAVVVQNMNIHRTVILLPRPCHGLGYVGILLAISWPRICWDTFGNIMA
jgi:hypothetical protein